MKLATLCEAFGAIGFPAASDASSPDRNAILEARKRIAAAVVDDEFFLDCIAREARRIRVSPLGAGLEPFFVDPSTGIRFAFGYWPPGTAAGPHEHNAWTITAVWRNELEVRTFDRDASYRQQTFVPKNLFRASAGSTGFIAEPCIHEPTNTSTEWTLSFHVSSPHDPPSERESGSLFASRREQSWLEASYRSVLAARTRQDFAEQLALVTATLANAETAAVLGECLASASSATRRALGRPALREGSDRKRPWRLSRSHPDLALRCADAGAGDVSLHAETSSGVLDGLVMNDAGRAALVFATQALSFDVRELPGSLTDEERAMVAEALETTGFFRRVDDELGQ
jgi:hypothetical protein